MAENKKKPDIQRTLPHSVDAEVSLLGCILVDGGILADVCQDINADDFYSPAHILIFESLSALLASGKTVDSVLLTDGLMRSGNLDKVGGAAYISTLASGVPSSANFREYVDIVYRTSMLRKLIRACSTVIDDAYTADDAEASLAEAEKLIFDLSARGEKSDLDRISGSVAEVLRRIDTLKTDKNAFKGVMTGFWALDSLTNGLHSGELIVLAARPAMGKSSFAMNIVENAAKKGKSCAVFSLEMPKAQIAQRLLCSCAGVPLSNASRADLSDAQWRSLFDTATVLGKFNIFVDDSSLITPAQILSKCRKLKSRYGLDLLVIDYIQLMSSGKRNVENRQQEVSDISRSLKIMAKELDVPVIALSQLSRQIEMRQGKPQLSDLRESGAIEQDADIVMFIHKEKTDNESGQKDDERELIVAKHRNGALDEIPLLWKGELVRFESLSSTDAALRKQFRQNEEEKKKREERMKNGKSAKPQQEGKSEASDLNGTESSEGKDFGAPSDSGANPSGKTRGENLSGNKEKPSENAGEEKLSGKAEGADGLPKDGGGIPDETEGSLADAIAGFFASQPIMPDERPPLSDEDIPTEAEESAEENTTEDIPYPF